MKSKILFTIVICSLLVAFGFFAAQERSQAQSVGTSLSNFLFDCETTGLNYRLIEGQYHEHVSGVVHVGTNFLIYNISPWKTVTLGDVHFFQPDGTEIVWNGITGITVASLGSHNFSIGDSGIAPQLPGTKGSYLVAITWYGGANDAQIVAAVNDWDINTYAKISSRTAYPFPAPLP